MLKIYGWKRSRAARCMWVMEEMSLDYEQVPLNPHAGETCTPEVSGAESERQDPDAGSRRLRPGGKHGHKLVSASSFPGTLLPRDPRHGAKVQQWTLWAITELEPPVVAIMREGRRPRNRSMAPGSRPGMPAFMGSGRRCSSRTSTVRSSCFPATRSRSPISTWRPSPAACRHSISPWIATRLWRIGCSAAFRARHGLASSSRKP